MSTKLFSLNSLMERKRKPQPQERRDQLALVKAVAWAWYQHGSRSKATKSMNEFDVTRTHYFSARPSRFKLEAMRMDKVGDLRCSRLEVETETNNKSLLDAYEVQSISRRLNDNGSIRLNDKKRIIKFKGFWARINVAVACGGGDDVLYVKHMSTSS